MATDRIRMTGLVSGLDTETIVQALVSAASYKTTKLKNTQTKLGWKQETWKSLNSEVYNLYNGKIDNLRFEGNYNAKKATIDSNVASISADNNAVLGSQTLEVHQMATSGYLTGDVVKTYGVGKTADGSTTFAELVNTSAGSADFTADELNSGIKIKVSVGKDATPQEITIKGSDTMDEIAEKFSKIGLNANFDAKTGRFFLSSTKSGEDANFEIEYGENEAGGQRAIERLGLKYTENNAASGAVKIKGQNAKIVLNGAEFESASNTFNINGLNITVQGISEKVADPDDPTKTKYKASTITTSVDVDAIYDSIKDFFKTYNELIKKMDTYYNAKANKDYDVLSEDEKEAMSDDEVEKWEQTIKDSLLRKDDNLSKLIDLFKGSLSQTIKLENGKSYSLSSFGINTLDYFTAGENEHGMYHIDGDQDDENSKSKDDALKKMIASNPEDTSKFFSQLFKDVYNKLNKEMRFIEDTRSAMKVYDDKTLQKEYDKLTSDIKKQEEKVTEMEDHYYSQFTAMEKALTKLNSQSSSFASMLGQ